MLTTERKKRQKKRKKDYIMIKRSTTPYKTILLYIKYGLYKVNTLREKFTGLFDYKSRE